MACSTGPSLPDRPTVALGLVVNFQTCHGQTGNQSHQASAEPAEGPHIRYDQQVLSTGHGRADDQQSDGTVFYHFPAAENMDGTDAAQIGGHPQQDRGPRPEIL